MPRPPSPPRIRRWRGKYYVFYFCPLRRRAVRLSCEEHGATNAASRRELLKNYQLSVKVDEVAALEGRTSRPVYDTPFTEALARVEKNIQERVKVRSVSVNSREGLAETSAESMLRTLRWFREWLAWNGHLRLSAGDLTAEHIRQFIRSLAVEAGKHGARAVHRSPATLNKHRRALGAALRWLEEQRPRLFPDFAGVAAALRQQRTQPPQPRSFSPAELQRFYLELVAREQPSYARAVQDDRRTTKRRSWLQPAQAHSNTPLSKLFLLLALSGMRLQEALQLRWEHVDLERGRLAITATKTGLSRILPLCAAPEGDVAPKFVTLLKRWRLEAGARGFVLPHAAPTRDNRTPAPAFNRKGWEAVGDELMLRELTPQRLRQNMASYLASVGVPAAVAALWMGHSAAVAERYYRSNVLDRRQGASVEQAMGLDNIREISDAAG